MANSKELAELKAEIIDQRGYWTRFHQVLLDQCPNFLRAYLRFQSAPMKTGLLEPKVREFIYVAIDASVDHLYDRGTRRHIEFALKRGATPEEVLQVILLTTAVSAHHPHELGLRLLLEELGASQPSVQLTPEERRLKDAYVAATGHWPETGDYMLRQTPDFAAGYLGYGITAWTAGPLPDKVKEFICLAVCAAPTCLYEPGMRRHIRGALRAGASTGEISEVLQLAAALSIHTCTYALPGLDDVMHGKYVE